jgi:hypothetical protein
MSTTTQKLEKGYKITTDLGNGHSISSVMKADLKGIAYTKATGDRFTKEHQNKGLVYLSQVVKELLGVEIDLNAERRKAIESIRAGEKQDPADELASMAH